MKRKTIFISIYVLGLLFVLTLGVVQAQEPDDRERPEGGLAVEAVVSSKFNYQGMLSEDGSPVSGTRDMVFHLFSEDSCTTMVGGNISMPGVEVNDGLFSVELTVNQSHFNGQGLWLGVQVDGTTIGCQEILPVPYALSLRPGANITGEMGNWDALHAVNTAEEGPSYGIYARSYSTSGRGVYGFASASTGSIYGVYGRSSSTSGTGVYGYVDQSSGQTFGIWGESNSASGTGVYARGRDAGADLILGGNANTASGDDGKIYSDPDYASSDIYLISNDTLRIDLDQDGDGEDADFEIRNAADNLIFNVDESGTVRFGGAGVAAFPRPAYDSGWVTLSQGGDASRTHSLGGNVENYVVDLTCKRSPGGAGINNWGVGGDANWTEYYGAYWSLLTTTSISIHRGAHDSDCPQARVRIWMYP